MQFTEDFPADHKMRRNIAAFRMCYFGRRYPKTGFGHGHCQNRYPTLQYEMPLPFQIQFSFSKFPFIE